MRGRRGRQAGLTLLEVLVSIIIFMFGILGLVGIQTSMIKAQTNSKFRADAAYLGAELRGRMWGDLANIASYNGAKCVSTQACKEWQDKVGKVLPSGTGEVAVTGMGDVTITVKWTLPDGQSHQHVTESTIVPRV